VSPAPSPDAAADVDTTTEERVARNQAVFRDANAGVAAAAQRNRFSDEPVPFICECPDRTCTQVVAVSLEQYAHVRSNPRWFIHAAGHDVTSGGVGAVVEDHGDWVVAEKCGHAGDVAEALAEPASPGDA
jgi:hypothetical protein